MCSNVIIQHEKKSFTILEFCLLFIIHNFKIIGYNKINFTEQTPFWKVNGHSATQELIAFYGTPKVHYRVQRISPRVRILNQMNAAHILWSYFYKIREL
jgi:hypothetical protein